MQGRRRCVSIKSCRRFLPAISSENEMCTSMKRYKRGREFFLWICLYQLPVIEREATVWIKLVLRCFLERRELFLCIRNLYILLFFDQGMFAAELKEKLFLFSSFMSDISTQVFNEQADGSITTLVHTHEHQFVRSLFSRLCVQRLMMRS